MAQVVLGVGVGLFAVFPPLPATPRAAEAAAALTSLALAAISLLLLPALPAWATTLSVCLSVLLIDLLASAMPTGQGRVVASLGLMMLFVFAAQHLSRRHVLVVLVAGVGGFLAALMVEPRIPGALVYALAIALVLMGVTAQVARLESRLRFQAHHDPLTGALNRNGLAERAPAARDLSVRAGRGTTVVILDLDRFKQYNDEHGHAQGDRALADLVAAWRPLLRSSDMVGRLGGDEFALVLPGSPPEDVGALLERLHEASALPWSAGAESWLADDDLFEALARADRHLYRAKRARVIDLTREATVPQTDVTPPGAT